MANDYNKEHLDSPLVVHKVTDASYHETENIVDVDATHVEEDTATLERHRFRKEKKSSKWPIIITFIVVVVAVFCYLYFSGSLAGIGLGTATTTTEPATEEYTLPANPYDGIITVKGTYIFFEGTEVDGIEGLQREVRYLDSGTSFVVQDEDADSTFLYEEILPLLEQYGIEAEVRYVVSSGLTSRYETTTAAQTSQSTSQAPSGSTSQ